MKLIPDQNDLQTALPMWVLFMTSFFLLKEMVFKPSLKIIAERRRQTSGTESKVRQLQEQTEVKLKEYEALMSEARVVARSSRDEILKAAEVQQKEIIGEARVKAERYMSEMKIQIQAESEQVRSQLKGQSDQLAHSITEKLLDRKVA